MTSSWGSAGFCGFVCANVRGREMPKHTNRKQQLTTYAKRVRNLPPPVPSFKSSQCFFETVKRDAKFDRSVVPADCLCYLLAFGISIHCIAFPRRPLFTSRTPTRT